MGAQKNRLNEHQKHMFRLKDQNIIIFSRFLFVWTYSIFELPLLIDFLLTVTRTETIFISGRGSAISSAKEGKTGFV